ncbi:MAG: hypothetical protein RL701_7451 [Pseudomonadota bacterium]
MKHSLVPMAAWLSAALLIACGGGDDDDASPTGPNCAPVAMCGGDVVGEWSIASFCPDTSKVPDEVKAICTTATLDYDEPTVSGTLSFKADKTFTQTASASGTGYIVLDKKCVEAAGNCTEAEGLINANSGTNQKLSCKDSSGGGCRCALHVSQSNKTDSGTYVVSGSKLTLDSGEKADSTFCVASDVLTLTVSLAPSANAVAFTGQLHLTKKK